MSTLARVRRDTGLACMLAAIVAALLVYAMTLGCGFVNYDDPWLVRDNPFLKELSWPALRAVFFEHGGPLSRTGAEYLPVRDLSYMIDFAIWGERSAGFHVTNWLVYVATIPVWFYALTTFGITRKVAGIAILVWSVHPSHAESVAWISERKGLLAMLFAGVCVLAYARYRRGDSARWLVLACVAAVCAVWSKATGAFAVGSLAALELVLPAARVAWRRSAIGIAVIAVVAGAAFVPVVTMATEAAIVGAHAPHGRIASVVGIHGFYLRLAAMVTPNAISYPIATDGPSTLELVLGALGFVALIAALVRGPRDVRAGAAIWVVGWLPIGQLILPLQQISVGDRFLLFPSLGLAIIVAAGIVRVDRRALQAALAAVIVLAGVGRSLDAALHWRSSRLLWERAVASNPHDTNAWSMYIEAVAAQPGSEAAVQALLARAMQLAPSPQLQLRAALLALGMDRTRGLALMREAAEAGNPIAMSNLALLLLEDRAQGASGPATADALAWARRGAVARPGDAHAHRTHGKAALAAGQPEEARGAFTTALGIEPGCTNELNLALALVALDRKAEARPHLDRCAADPVVGERARAVRASLDAKPAAPGLSVLVVLVDTVRADRLGPKHMPRLDAYARTATRFTRAYAQGANTPRSVPSLLASRMPSQLAYAKAFHNFPVVTDDNVLVFEVLAAAGLRTIFEGSHFYFVPQRGVAQGFAEYYNSGAKTLADSNADYAAPRIVPRAIARLAQAAQQRERFAMFVHLFEPHSTYIEHPEHPITAKGEAGLVAKYDAEVQVADRWLGQLLDALTANGLAESTLVVVLSDHGESFGAHVDPRGQRAFFHGMTLYDEILRVPLVVRLPGAQPGVRDDLVALLDVAPTIADALGLPMPPSFVGRSLLPALRGQPLAPRPVLAEMQPTPDLDIPVRVYTDGAHKIITTGTRTEVYAIAGDPDEKHELSAKDPALAARLRAALDRWTGNLAPTR